MCLPEVNNTRKKKTDVVKTAPSKNVGLEIAKTVKKYTMKMCLSPAPLPFISRKHEN